MKKIEQDRSLDVIDWSVALYVCEDLIPLVDWSLDTTVEDSPSILGLYDGNKITIWPRMEGGVVVWDAKFARDMKSGSVVILAVGRPTVRHAVERLKTAQKSTRKKIRETFRQHRTNCQEEGCSEPTHGRGWCKSHYNEWMKERKRLGMPPLSGRKIAGWSRDYIKCIDVDCNTPELPHKAGGRCARCWARHYQRQRRAQQRTVEVSDE